MELTTIALAVPAAWIAYKALTSKATPTANPMTATHGNPKPTTEERAAAVKAQLAKAGSTGYPSGQSITRIIAATTPDGRVYDKTNIPWMHEDNLRRKSLNLSGRWNPQPQDYPDYVEYAKRVGLGPG